MLHKFVGPRLSKKAVLGLSVAVVLGLTACGTDSETQADDATTPKSTSTAASGSDSANDAGDSTASDDESAPSENDGEAGDETDDSDSSSDETGESPGWAKEVTKPGKKLDSMKLGDVTITVYQVDTGKAPKDSMLVDKESKKPLLQKGDPVVFLNYVVTNHGDPIKLGSSLVDVKAKYPDWKYLSGMPTVSDNDLMEKKNINDRAIDQVKDPTVYPLKNGETISFGVAFKYKKNKPVELEASYVPVDPKGDLIHDDKVENKAKIQLK